MLMSADQIVAARWTLARASLRWTQARAVEELAKVGIAWSISTLSQVEGSIAGKRTKEFSASELVALSQCTGYSVPWFLCPLPSEDRYGLLPGPIVPREGKRHVTPDELVEAICRNPEALAAALNEAAPSLTPATRARYLPNEGT